MTHPSTRPVVEKFCQCGDALSEHADGGDGPCDAIHRWHNVYTGQVYRNLPSRACECQQFVLQSFVYAGQPGVRHTLDCRCWRCQEDRDTFEALFAERLQVETSFREAATR